MEAFLSSPFPCFVAKPQVQSLDRDSITMPLSSWMPSSPSLDMEVALRHLNASSSSSSSADEDVLMADPFLDYVNEVMMEETTEDVIRESEDAEASYYAIMSDLYNIIGEPSPLDSASSEDVSALHLSGTPIPSCDPTRNESDFGFHHSHPCEKDQDYLQHIGIIKPCVGLSSETPNLGFATSLEKRKAEVSLMKQHLEEVDKYASQTDVMTYTQLSKRAHEHAVLQRISDSESSNGRMANEHSNSNSNLLLSDSLQTSNIDLSFEEVKDDAGYAALYVGKLCLSDSSATISRSNSGDGEKTNKTSNVGHKGRKSDTNTTAEEPWCFDVREVLINCAQAVSIGDMKRAMQIVQELYQVYGASEEGNGMQRAAHYFCTALVARMKGTGGHHYKIMCNNPPPTAVFLRALKAWYEVTPYMRIMHYFANMNILKAAKGASRLHIVDYGIMHGIQWPCLISALADSKGTPPLLVITGIEFPGPGENPYERLEASGRRLAAYARTYNVPFEFHPITADKWEDIDPTSLCLHENEFVVVNCIKRLCYLADESVDQSSPICPREKLLMRMRSIKPNLLLVAASNAAFTSPFFVSRFRQALHYYYNSFDLLNSICHDNSEKLVVERAILFRRILNVVACEGAERVERPETYKQWEARIKRAGFEQLPIPSVIISRSRSHVKQHYHKDFVVQEDANRWLLLGWKGRLSMAMSVWRPSHP